MKSRTLLLRLAVSVVGSACSQHQATPGPSPEALAALHADLRMVGGETTWVTHGPGYELVGRTKADLAAARPTLDRESALLSRVFPGDSLVRLVVKLRRVQPEGKPFILAAPVPTTTHGAVVEVVLPDLTPRKETEERRGPPGGGPAGIGIFGTHGPTIPVVRAWLSAHASGIKQEPARLMQATGELDDPRVPAWAESVIPALDADSLVDRYTTALASRPDNLIPLATYFTMPRPEPTIVSEGERAGGERGGGTPAGGTGAAGGGGGMSGGGSRGGMGGGRGGGGMMGGRRGGGTSSGTAGRSPVERPMFALSGAALFDAQSVVVGQYLSREGFDLIGALVDAQLRGGSVDELLTKRTGHTTDQMDADWRQWLTNRAAALHR